MLGRKRYPQLDSRLFTAFLAASETENFTSAAKQAFMTQSGVSQHIARLEEQVGVALFKRIGKHVKLTEAGQRLKRYIEELGGKTESILNELREQQAAPAGLVRYAMPPSCLLSPHFGMLLEKRHRYPDIELEVSLRPSERVIQLLLNDGIDFGFSTVRLEHPNIEYRIFCEEEYILAGASPEVFADLDEVNIYEHRFISYPGADVYINYWLRHRFPEFNNLDFLSLTISGHINSLDGAITMAQGGLGIGVFPRHCIQDALTNGTLHEYQTNLQPLMNPIYVVSLREFEYPASVRQVIDWFFEMHCPS